MKNGEANGHDGTSALRQGGQGQGVPGGAGGPDHSPSIVATGDSLPQPHQADSLPPPPGAPVPPMGFAGLGYLASKLPWGRGDPPPAPEVGVGPREQTAIMIL